MERKTRREKAAERESRWLGQIEREVWLSHRGERKSRGLILWWRNARRAYALREKARGEGGGGTGAAWGKQRPREKLSPTQGHIGAAAATRFATTIALPLVPTGSIWT